MTKDAVTADNVLDENARRYYLDVMGIQCWELLDGRERPVVDEKIEAVSDADNSGWPQLETAVQQCDRCPLHETQKQAFSGIGKQSADIMFVMLSPEKNAEANDLFSKMLSAINISIDDVYITSLLKCAVPARHTVTPHEIQQCDLYLKQQVKLLKPKRVVVLGETAIRCLLQKDSSLDDLRKQINMATQANETAEYNYDSVPLFVSYSPQELLQQPEHKRKAWLDLQQLQKIIES